MVYSLGFYLCDLDTLFSFFLTSSLSSIKYVLTLHELLETSSSYLLSWKALLGDTKMDFPGFLAQRKLGPSRKGIK